MTIDELNAAAGLTANDEIPLWDAEATGEPTKKITAQNFANAVKTLAGLVGTDAIIVGPTTTIAAGTTTQTLTGLTSNHRVIFWGFSSGGENDPPADITVTTAADGYTITVTNVTTSGVTMTPVFIAPQN